MAQRQEWKGQVEPGIRKYLGRGGQRWYRVQLGSRGKGNRKSQVVATLEAAVALKRQWLEGGLPVDTAAPAAGEEAQRTLDDALRERGAALTTKVAARTGSPATVKFCDHVRRTLAKWEERLDARPVRSVTLEHLEAFRDWRHVTGGLKPPSVNRELRELACAVKLYQPEFKAVGIELDEGDEERVRFVPDDKWHVFDALALKYGPRFARMAEIQLHCSFRPGEVRVLEQAQVNLPAREIRLRADQTKTRAARTVRLPRPPSSSSRRSSPTRRRRARPAGSFQPAHRGALFRRLALVPLAPGDAQGRDADFHLHDLRHHVPTIAVTKGANERTLMKLGGWTSARSEALRPCPHRGRGPLSGARWGAGLTPTGDGLSSARTLQ